MCVDGCVSVWVAVCVGVQRVFLHGNVFLYVCVLRLLTCYFVQHGSKYISLKESTRLVSNGTTGLVTWPVSIQGYKNVVSTFCEVLLCM